MSYISVYRKVLSLVLACCLCATSVPARAEALWQADAPLDQTGDPLYQGYTVEECNRADEASLQAEIEAIALAVLGEARAGVDAAGVVERKWVELDVGTLFDQEVDAAIARVKSEEDYWNRFLSGWSPAKAEELSNQVATYVFESPLFQSKLEELSTAIAAGLAAEIEAMSARSASSALLCMQSYVSDKYSQTLFLMFEEEINTEVDSGEYELQEGILQGPVETHAKALSGLGIIIASQITGRIAQALGKKIAGRLAGKIAGRVLGRIGSAAIPVAGWVIGAGLIVWDLVEGAEGALPQIRTAIQSEEVKQEIRTEIASTIETSLTEETGEIARLLATSLSADWQEFCTRHEHLCTLSNQNETFKELLDGTALEDVSKVGLLVDAYVETKGQDELAVALDDGEFVSLAGLPAAAADLLRHTGSPATVLAWYRLAGDLLDQVVTYEVYKYKSPHDLTPQLFATFITIRDNHVLSKLLPLDNSDLEVLALLPVEHLKVIAADVSVTELEWLAGHLAQVDAAEVESLGRQLAGGTLTIAALQNPEPLLEQSQPVAEKSGGVEMDNQGEMTFVDRLLTTPSMGAARQFLDDLFSGNEVLIAAVILLFLLLGMGVILSNRRNSYKDSR